MHHIDDDWYLFGGPNRNWLNKGFGSEFFSIRRNILFYKPKLDIYNIFQARDWLAMDDKESLLSGNTRLEETACTCMGRLNLPPIWTKT